MGVDGCGWAWMGVDGAFFDRACFMCVCVCVSVWVWVGVCV